jgi:hypothetical protein
VGADELRKNGMMAHPLDCLTRCAGASLPLMDVAFTVIIKAFGSPAPPNVTGLTSGL